MTVIKTRLGTNEDGTPLYHYHSDGPLVMTGPVTGQVRLPDGTVYDVSEPFIEVAPGHELALSDAIAERHVRDGHPRHDAEHPFVHTPSTLTHDGSTRFADAVHDHVVAIQDSAPGAIIAELSAKTTKGGGKS